MHVFIRIMASIFLLFLLLLSGSAHSSSNPSSTAQLQRLIKSGTQTSTVSQPIQAQLQAFINGQRTVQAGGNKSSSQNKSKPISQGRIQKNRFNPVDNTPSFVKGQLTNIDINDLNQLSTHQQVELYWNTLKEQNNNLLAMSNEDGSFLLNKYKLDSLNHLHVWYQQAYQGIPLWGKEILFHADEKKQAN